jgi:hypothetical protein
MDEERMKIMLARPDGNMAKVHVSDFNLHKIEARISCGLYLDAVKFKRALTVTKILTPPSGLCRQCAGHHTLKKTAHDILSKKRLPPALGRNHVCRQLASQCP